MVIRLHSLHIALLLMFSLTSCFTFRASPKKLDSYFKMKGVNGSVKYYTSHGKKMQYAIAGDTAKPMLLFVHGSPGSLSAFTGYVADSLLLKHALLISADRPGFGYSNFGQAEPSLAKQGEFLKDLIDIYPTSRPVILVGHSLGGPLVAKMAAAYPSTIDGIVIIAGSIDPDLEPNETWFRAPLATPFLSWILPRSLRASNEELYQLKPQLELMKTDWKNITCPVLVIHGKKDGLVPFGNVAFAKKMLVNTSPEFVVDDEGTHFIVWENRELITNALVAFLQKVTDAQRAE
jgi:pimeloyl-ACP methyl ester carboxylesterase